MDDLEEIHIPERDRRSDGPAPVGTPRPASLKYLIVYKDFDTVPKSLQTFVKEKITTEFSPFDVELDFTGNRAAKDLTISFTSEMPVLPIYGESERAEYDGTPLRGEGTIYVRAMQVTRMETAAGSCYDVFPETADKLGALIAYTAIHETGHMLGLNHGGYDDGGHSADTANWMWDPGSLPSTGPRRPFYFLYTVKDGDTLSDIISRYNREALDRCHVGPPGLTVSSVWSHPANKNSGFIADPKRPLHPGDSNYIYTGEKVALFNYNVKSTGFLAYVAGYTGLPKRFFKEQKETMKTFIAKRPK